MAADETTVDEIDADSLRDLLANPPDGFVAARTALARELRTRKERVAAKAVTAIRRPSWSDWALNRAATAAPEVAERFTAAAAMMREAQDAVVAGQKGGDVRGAMRELRDATAVLVGEAVAVLGSAGRRSPDRAELSVRLGEIAGSEQAVGRLRIGVLGSGAATPVADDTTRRGRPARPPRDTRSEQGAAAAPKKTAAKRGPVSAKAKDTSAAAAVRNEGAEQRRRLRTERDAARRDRKAAERSLRRAESAVTAAREQHDAARQAVVDAEQALQRASTHRDEAAAELADRSRAVEAADAALGAAVES